MGAEDAARRGGPDLIRKYLADFKENPPENDAQEAERLKAIATKRYEALEKAQRAAAIAAQEPIVKADEAGGIDPLEVDIQGFDSKGNTST
jgi:hypothetical protein